MSTDKAPDSERGYQAGPKLKVEYENISWWSAWTQDKEAHQYLIGEVTNLRNKQGSRYLNFRKLNSLYEFGYKGGLYESADDMPLGEAQNAYNAAANVIDTVHAKVHKNKLVPMPITKGGGALQRKRAKDLGKILDGLYEENDVGLIEEDAGYDALNCGAGIAKTYSEFGRVKACFVPCDDITLDDAEGRATRCLYETKRMDRFQALELYGGDEDWLHGERATRRDRILKCKQATIKGGAPATMNQIEVTEAYHLPSGPDAGDGRLAVVIDNCTLVDVEWKRPRFRHHFMTPKPRRRGAWGLALAHDLAANQREYEKTTAKIQRGINSVGSHIIASKSANVSERDFDNAMGTFIEYDGPHQPTAFNPDGVNNQLLQYNQSIPNTMMSAHGVSSLSAKGEIPAGLTQASGKALEVYDDIDAEGLRPYHAARGRFHSSLAQGFIDEGRELVENGETYSVRYKGKGAVEDLDWKKVILDEDEYILTIPSINALSTSPSARYAQLEARFNAGTITADQFKRLDEMPDLQAENEMDTADEDIIDRNLDIMVTEGRYMAPQPFDNLDMCVHRGGKFYNLCRQRGESESALAMIRDYIAAAADLKTQSAPPAPAPPMMDPGMPPPPGGPPMDPMMPPGMPPPGMPPMPPGPPMGPPMNGMPPGMAA